MVHHNVIINVLANNIYYYNLLELILVLIGKNYMSILVFYLFFIIKN